MSKLLKLYIWVLLFSPFFSYFIVNYLELIPYYFWGSLGSIIAALLIIRGGVKIPKLIYPLILLAIYYFSWNFFNGRFEKFGFIKLLFKDRTLHTISFLILVRNMNFTTKDLKKYLSVFKIYIILSVLFTIIQVLFNSSFFLPEQLTYFDGETAKYEIRNVSMWGYLSLLDVGLSFIPILAIVIHKSIVNKSKLTVFWLFCGAFVSILTNSRWTMVNYILVLIYTGYLYYKINNIHLFGIIKYGIMVLVISIVSLSLIKNYVYNLNDFYNNRIYSSSAESRLYGYQMFLKYFPDKPWFGTGVRVGEDLSADLAGKSSQIHVGYLSHLYEFGIIGSVILLFFWFKVVKYVWLIGKISGNFVYLVMFLCFLAANVTLVEYSFYYLGVLVIFIFTSNNESYVTIM